MQGDNANGFYTVQSLAAARALVDPRQQRYLEPFISRAEAIKPASEHLGVPLNKMYRAVKRFEALGIVEVRRRETQRGHRVSYYQTPARAFFIPFSLISLNEVFAVVGKRFDKEMLASSVNAWETQVDSQQSWGTKVYKSASGRVVVNGPFDSRTGEVWQNPNIVNMWQKVKLNNEDAQALRRDLADLMMRYVQKGGSGDDTYLIHMAAVPSEGE